MNVIKFYSNFYSNFSCNIFMSSGAIKKKPRKNLTVTLIIFSRGSIKMYSVDLK